MKPLNLIVAAWLGAATLLGVYAATDAPPVDAPKASKLPEVLAKALASAENVELISLDPEDRSKTDARPAFRDFTRLGSTTVKGKEAVAALAKELERHVGGPDAVGAKCFIPRHGLTVKGENGPIDVVICFECAWMYVYSGDKGESRRVALSRGKDEALSQMLADAKVPLPVPAKK